MDLMNLLCWISSASVRAFRCVCRVETNNKLWKGVAARSASTVDGGAKVFLEGRRGVGGGCGRVSCRSGAVSGADAAGSPGAAALHRGRSGADAAALHRGRSDRVTQSPRVLYTI